LHSKTSTTFAVRPGDTPAGLLFEVGSPTRRGTWDPGPIHPLRRVAQSCQSYSASTRPGNSGSGPGSPFNEPGINSPNGGTGGANYSEKSQYDVACFQQASHH